MNTSIADGSPDVSVIIPHYNDQVRLRRCLTELFANEVCAAEIIVVDNGSPEPLDAVAADFPSARFFIEREKGAGPARNRGVAESRGRILAFLDADCVPDPDWLETVRRVAAQADVVGGRVSVFDETPPPRTGAQAFEAVFAFRVQSYIVLNQSAITANLVTSRRVFDHVGPFGNGISEDTEWTKRAVAKGHSLLYADDLHVSHPSRTDWEALQRKWRRLTDESYALAKMSGRPRIRWVCKALLMPASIIVHLPRVLFSPALNGSRERLAAAMMLARLRMVRMAWMLKQVLE
jgi:glycosyltransferase involved in cell wall biosynthesis